MKTADIDKNFKSDSITKQDILWLDPLEEPFRIYGMCHSENSLPLCRMDPLFITKLNSSLQELAYHTSGIRVRFRTDSDYFALKARLRNGNDMSHMPRTGSAGFDLYIGSGERPVFRKIFMPDAQSDEVIGEYFFTQKGMKEITINFPLYNGVNEIAFGFDSGAALESPHPYRIEKPIVFYGSSITQGGCASRPGNSYSQILSRWLDADVINLGFSGSAMGEKEMAEMISSLPMSAFVLDYDHNAPNAQHLEKTHFEFFKTVREKNPLLPILVLSKSDYTPEDPEDSQRREVVRNTCLRAAAENDKNVIYINGKELFGDFERDACTVDGVHPNDLGFMRMAERVYKPLKEIFG